MKKTVFVLLAIVALACCLCPEPATAADALRSALAPVPNISPADFPAPATVALQAAPSEPESHWLWSLLITEPVAKGILWALEAGVAALIGMLGLKGSKIVHCILFIAAAVRETFIAFVRPAKLASKDGKLTEDERSEAMRQALARARGYAAEKGMDLFKLISKDVASAIAELCVRLFKGNKKATVALPLPDLSPSAPSV